MRQIITRRKHVRCRPNAETASVDVRKTVYTKETAFSLGSIFKSKKSASAPAPIAKPKAQHRLEKIANSQAAKVLDTHHKRVAQISRGTNNKLAEIHKGVKDHMAARSDKARHIVSQRSAARKQGYKVIGRIATKPIQIRTMDHKVLAV